MLIKSHELYPYYLHYLETKKMNSGAKKLAEISESMFFDFQKKWQLQPGFKEKWENALISQRRDENIEVVLEQDVYDLFFEPLDEEVDEISKDDEFEIFLDSLESKTSKQNQNIEDDLFDF
jgi:hypothetical protein